MSDPALATKAPESDAIEDQAQPQTQPPAISPHDSVAQTGASTGMGEHCTTDRPLSTSQQHQRPSGELSQFDDIDVYVSKPADYPNTPGKLLLLLTGGTGVKSVNNQLQADLWAKEGFVVVMPDQFAGDPAPNTTTMAIASPTGGTGEGSGFGIGLLEQVKLRAAETAKSFMIDMWLARQTAEKVLPRLAKVLEAMRDEYADALANGGGLYAVGYCFGAKYVLILAGERGEEAMVSGERKGQGDEEAALRSGKLDGPVIKAGAIAHATLVTREDLLGIKAPVSMACVEEDPLFPEEILDVGRKHLGTASVKHEIKMYSGVPHGFAVVGQYADPKIQEAQEQAFIQMLGWLKAH